jgi:uncharacterized protein YdeI (YjbR/CyaY-like superfamily)
MSQIEILEGVLHTVPDDLKEVLIKNPDLLAKWNSLTAIARNEWICWLTIYKKEETRTKHLEQIQVEILEGQKRPCCWPGCPHRNPKTAKWF